jgi:hypothetical protein
VVEASLDDPPQLICKRTRLFGCQVEPEQLYGDETVLRGLVGAEDGPENTCADLMQNPEWPERTWRRKRGRIAFGQRRKLLADGFIDASTPNANLCSGGILFPEAPVQP